MTQAGEILGANLLAMSTTDWIVWIAAPLLVLMVGFAFFLFLPSKKKTKSRITIHPKETVVINAAGPRKCPACRLDLENGHARARCANKPPHEIHEDCRELTRGKCPTCNKDLL